MSFSIKNSSTFKLSPDKDLLDEQKELKTVVEKFLINNKAKNHGCFIIHGDADTGESVFLNRLLLDLQTYARQNKQHPLFGSDNYLLVNHPEMLKAYRNATESVALLKKKDYERPTTFINRMHKTGQKADIVLVDEAHLLLTSPDRYNHFAQDNHLEEILNLARLVVVIFDEKQALKAKSWWDINVLEKVVGNDSFDTYRLTKQFRMNTSMVHQTWIEQFCQGNVLPLPKVQESGFTLKIFSDAQEMYEQVKNHNQHDGLSRMLATYDYPYRLDGNDYFIEEGRFKLRWDRAKPQAKDPWAERPDTIEEVGSVYTIQGFDLNYVGLILGPSVTWDPIAQRLLIDPSQYEDKAAFNGLGQRDNAEQIKRQIMLNSINVLMTRAINGLYIYAHDPLLRDHLLSLQSCSFKAIID